MRHPQYLINILFEVKDAEDKGFYEKAFALMDPFWDAAEQFPNAAGLSGEEAAEVFLRFGGIIGFLGNTQQISNAQEISKNLLTLALHRFESMKSAEKAAECENYLALAYSRTGEFTEAFDWLQAALSRNLPLNHPTRINSYVIETLLHTDSQHYEKVIARARQLSKIFSDHASDLHHGCFHNHLAIAHKNLGKGDEALANLKLARDFFRRANHQIYYGSAENNLAQWCHKNGHFAEAHASAEKAAIIFQRLGDKVREGFTLDTRAQIFAAQGNFESALQYVDKAVELLQGGESYRKLVETYRTKISILLNLSRLAEALTVMTAAHNLAALHISQELSKEVIEKTAALIEQKHGSFSD